MSNNVNIIIADYHNEQHASEVSMLLNAYASDPMGGGEPLSDYVQANLASELAKSGIAFSIIAYVDDKPAGLVNCIHGFSSFKCKPLINIHDVVVLKEFRGMKLSTRMLEKVEAIAREKGCCKLTLEVLSKNEPAKHSYINFGFKGYEMNPEHGHALFWDNSLTTDRLILRDFSEKDRKAHHLMYSHSDFQKLYSEEDCQSEKIDGLVTLFIQQAQEPHRKQFHLAITLKETDTYIGTAGLRIEDNSTASMGCGVSIEHQGQGYAKEAMQALIKFGVNQHKLQSIYAETIADNKSAIRLCQQLGFTEKERRANDRLFKDKLWDTVVMEKVEK